MSPVAYNIFFLLSTSLCPSQPTLSVRPSHSFTPYAPPTPSIHPSHPLYPFHPFHTPLSPPTPLPPLPYAPPSPSLFPPFLGV